MKKRLNKKLKKKSNSYISLQKAQKYCSYSQEYLSLRARQGKLKAVKIGRNWVTKKEWIKDYSLEFKKGHQKKERNKASKKKLLNKKSRTNRKKEKIIKVIFPPEDLPVGQFSEPIQNLLAQSKKENPGFNFGLLFVIVSILIISGVFLNISNWQMVLNHIGTHVSIINHGGDIFIRENMSLIEYSFGVSKQAANSILASEMMANAEYIFYYDLEIFKEYQEWLKSQIPFFSRK